LQKTLSNFPLGERLEVNKQPKETSAKSGAVTNLASSESHSQDPSNENEYVQLQSGIFKCALVLSALAVVFTAIVIDFHSSISVLVGALSGLVYLRLLARSIGRLGVQSQSVGKAQLLVPVILVVVVTRLPQLELLPSLVGFLLYKPSLIIQFLLKP